LTGGCRKRGFQYSYCLNNPLIYVDETGEFWHIVIGAVVGGVINWVSHGCQFNMKGLSYFGVGAAGGALAAAFPGAAMYIAAGTSSANSILQQGFASNWKDINFKQVAFDGIMGGLTSYAGGELGKMIGADKWFSGIKSPLLRNTLEGITTNTIVGGALGGTFALLDDDPETNLWSGAWNGIKMGALTGTISGIGNAAQYSIDNKVNFVTGKYSKPLYHYTTVENADIIMSSQLGKTDDGWNYLTPDGTKTPIQARIDLALPPGNTGDALIMVKPNSVYPKDIIYQGNVQGNIYGRGGGGYEMIYKGTINTKYLLRLR